MARAIRISNEKKRDGEVSFEGATVKKTIQHVLADGSERSNIKLLKSTLDLTEDVLVAKFGNLKDLGEAIIDGDPELDMEVIGRKIGKTHKLYLNKDNKIAYRVNMVQVRHAVDGSELSRKDAEKESSNVSGEHIITWSGKKFAKDIAIRQFVFIRKYQLKHTNGLTYDFLYAIAKELHDEKCMMFVGSGPKGMGPMRFTKGGENYRGLLEGRVDGERYCLILHLTNMEVKGI